MKSKTTKEKRVSLKSRETVLYGIAAVLVAVTVTDSLVDRFGQYLRSLVVNPYQLYLAELEQNNLEQINDRMRREIISLRTRQSSTRKIERTLVEKLDTIEKAIEDATNLNLFTVQHAPSNGRIKPNQPPQGKLAAVLDSINLTKTKTLEEELGIGGAEGVCEDACVEPGDSGRGTGGSLFRGADPVVNSMTVTQMRAERFVEVLRTLPIGAPVQARVSSSYGYRRSPFSRKRTYHYGVDLSLPSGNPVRATGGGKVVKSVYNRTYGNYVDIEHLSGLVTRYAHLKASHVKAGDLISRGDVIGLCGSTGRSTGPHVHYEVRYKGRPRNPEPFVQLAQTLTELLPVRDEVV